MDDEITWRRFILRDFSFTFAAGFVGPQSYRSMMHVQRSTAVAATETLSQLQVEVQNLQQRKKEVTTQLARTEETLSTTSASLTVLTTPQNPLSPIPLVKEEIFYDIAQAKLAQGNDGTINARGKRGRPLKLVHVPIAENSASTASKSSTRNRSKVIEKVTQLIAGKSNGDIIAQQTAAIQRDKATFSNAANSAGLKQFGTFNIDTMCSLSNEMPLSTIGVLKKMFRENFGMDPFSPLSHIRSKRDELSFQYECGTFNIDSKDEIHYLRVTDIREVIKRTVVALHEAGQLEQLTNCPPGTLRLLISVDKGGSSTKLLLQVLNTIKRHSIQSGRLLAMMRGGDSYKNIEACMQQVIKKVYQEARNMAELALPCCPTAATPTTATAKTTTTATSSQPTAEPPTPRLMQHLAKLGLSPSTGSCRGTISPSCKLCRRDAGPSASMPSTVTSCQITAGGDWLSVAALLGLTGPKGRHFCNLCLSTQSSLKKGQPHAPMQLPRYEHFVTTTFQQRTFEDMESDHRDFVAAGACHDKVANFNNCLHPSILEGSGPVIQSVSCTPLHIFLGLGDQVLKIIEQQAANLDEQVKCMHGDCGEDLNRLLNQRDEYYNLLVKEERNEADLKDSVQEVEGELEKLNESTTPAAGDREAARQMKSVKAKLKAATAAHRRATQARTTAEKQLEQCNKAISQSRGPFSRKLEEILTNLRLQRCAYHGGALVGCDVHKLMDPTTIHKICGALSPMRLQLIDGTNHKFGDHKVRQKATTLMMKLAQVYKLATANRPLCIHEIALVKVRTSSYATFLPVNYPEETVRPKLHVLAHHFPEKAELQGSIGMETEQLIESIHPFLNRKERQFASVKNSSQQMGLMAKSQWVASAQLPNYRK